MNIKSSWFPKLFYILHQHPIPKLILEQVSFFFKRLSRLSVSMVIRDLLRLMRVLYGSVMDAFMNFSNHSELSCLLALFFHSLGLSQPHSETLSRKLQISLDTSLCSHIPYLPLSTQDNVSTLYCLNTVLKHTCSGLGNWKWQLAWTH